MLIFVYRNEANEWKLRAGVIAPDAETFKASPAAYCVDFSAALDAWSTDLLTYPAENGDGTLREKTRAELYNEGKITLKAWEREQNGTIITVEPLVHQRGEIEKSKDERYEARMEELENIYAEVKKFTISEAGLEMSSSIEDRTEALRWLELEREHLGAEAGNLILNGDERTPNRARLLQMMLKIKKAEIAMFKKYKEIKTSLSNETNKDTAIELIDKAKEKLDKAKEDVLNG